MVSNNIILYSIYLIILIVVFVLLEKFPLKFNFFSKKQEKTIKLCPKCGSDDWKFPNPIRCTESMINLPQMVNNLYECKKCGYIGIFFLKDKDSKVKIKDVSKKKPQKGKSGTISRDYKKIITILLVFFVVGSIIGTFGGLAAGIFASVMYDNYKKKDNFQK